MNTWGGGDIHKKQAGGILKYFQLWFTVMFPYALSQ